MTRNTSVHDLDLVAGDASLDLANTMSPRTGNRPRDHLRSYPELLVWATRTGLLAANEAGRLEKQAHRRPAAAARALSRVKGLREAICAVFTAVAARRALPDEPFERLRAAVGQAIRHRVLRPVPEGGAAWAWDAEPDDFGRVAQQLAWHAALLLTDQTKLARVKECPGENCGWLFLDTTKNGSRLWCSSRDCGNRDKVDRYRRRKSRTASAAALAPADGKRRRSRRPPGRTRP
jgi:predicted RNA-binding Zn ribbon-like protein